MLSLTSGTIGAVLGVVVGYFLWDKMWFRAFSAAVFVDVTGLSSYRSVHSQRNY